jgi:hypothetical protein
LQCVLKWRWLFGFFVPRVGVSEKVRKKEKGAKRKALLRLRTNERDCGSFHRKGKRNKMRNRKRNRKKGIKEMIILRHKGI